MGQCSLDLHNFGLSIPDSARAQADTHLAGFKERALMSLIFASLALPLLHAIVHGFGLRLLFRRKFKALAEVHRLTAAHHAVELLCGIVCAPIMLFCTMRTMLCDPNDIFDSHIFDLGLGCGAVLVAMYSAELAGRLSSSRPLTVLHHALTMLFLVAIIFDMNELLMQVGMMFVSGAFLEFPLFGGLLVYRLSSNPGTTRALLRFGVAFYGLTRLFQLFVHFSLVVAFDLSNYSTFTLVWVLGVGPVLEAIQLYTFVIYYKILKRLKQRGNLTGSVGTVREPAIKKEMEAAKLEEIEASRHSEASRKSRGLNTPDPYQIYATTVNAIKVAGSGGLGTSEFEPELQTPVEESPTTHASNHLTLRGIGTLELVRRDAYEQQMPYTGAPGGPGASRGACTSGMAPPPLGQQPNGAGSWSKGTSPLIQGSSPMQQPPAAPRFSQ